MSRLTMLGAMGRGILATAMVLTVCEVPASPPAQADDPDVVITTPPTGDGGSGPVLTVTDLGAGSIAVDNPGATSPTTQQCSTLGATGGFCLGTSDQLVTPGSVPLGPVEIEGVPGSPYRLPGEAMDWIVDEAVAYVATSKGLQADDLVRAYARPDIRAYVFARLQSIANKKLYGEPMTDQETAANTELQAIYKDRLVQDSKGALEEYDRWSRDPCGYIPPAPPAGSGLPFVENDARNSTICSAAGSRFSLWAVTKGTPPADTFDRWASYRHPTPAMKALGDTTYQFAMTQTYGGIALAAGYVGAVGAGIVTVLSLMGMSTATAVSVGAALGFHAASVGLASVMGLVLAMSVAAIVVTVIAAILTLGVAIWQMVEDAKPGTDLRDRVTRAAANNDPLGIEAAQADYAGLDFATAQDPANPDKVAKIHTDSFRLQLFLQVHDWLMFRKNGDLIPDPTSGYNPTGATTSDDVHFAESGVPTDFITVHAPAGTVNAQNEPLSGYRVAISRGFLMVAELVTGEQSFRPYQPRTSVTFVDAQGRTSLMSLSVGQQDGPPIRKFLFATVDVDDSTLYSSDTSWTYEQHPGVLKTVTLLERLPLTPQVNVIPSIEGDMVADHVLDLRANLSTPGQSTTGGQYTWAIERLDDAGNVVDTLNPGGNLTGFGHRYTEPGDYRAKVTYSWTGPEPGSASGRVEFTILRPAAEAHRSDSMVEEPKVDDDRVSTGALSLDLRMTQNTRSDTFAVDVAWADDGLGSEVVEHYTVECVDAGANTCDTGPLVAPDPGQAPTNPQWSEPPTFVIPEGQNFLPHVRVTITNSYGETINRVYAIEGEHRPTYESMTPYVEMPAGTFSTVDVVQVSPSASFAPPSLPDIPQLQINPFVTDMIEHLPEGVTPRIEKKSNGEWWLQLRGAPTADSIGPWTFYFPFEQNVDDGNARRPAPVLATLEVVASTDPGYRGIIRGAPQHLSDRVYREEYPDYTVQAAQVLADGEDDFTDFAGTLRCKLVSGLNVVFDKPCAANGPFPWPDELISGSLFASVYVDPADPNASADPPYKVHLFTQFLEPTVTVDPVGTGDTPVTVRLHLEDHAQLPRLIASPFGAKGYTVTCSLDGAAYAPCLDSGTHTFAKTPLDHELDVKVKASDGATVVQRVTWNGGPVPSAPPVQKTLIASLSVQPAAPPALNATFALAVRYGGAVAPPYAAKRLDVTCVADGAKPVPCFDGGTLQLLRVPGTHQLAVTVKATDGQTVTESLAWSVATPKTKLTVKAPAKAEKGQRIKVRAKGLLPREKFVVKVGNEKVAKGLANDRGRMATFLELSERLSVGKVKIVVRGATKSRLGKDVVQVVAPAVRALDPRVSLMPV